MILGVPKENRLGETRIALTPDAVKKLVKKGYTVHVESQAGDLAGFSDEAFQKSGAKKVSKAEVWQSSLVIKIHKPLPEEIQQCRPGGGLVCLVAPYEQDGTLEALAQAKVDTIGLECLPRTSRAQSMDVLSSQAGIAGYRAVIEAAYQYGRFFPLMMTSAGSSKAVKLIVLGAGVAGLQAIATARRLGAQVEAYDIRKEVQEQIQSLGAKFVEFQMGEEGLSSGGYARELSKQAQQRLQQALTERLKSYDIIISTAHVPGKKAPCLITTEAVEGMRPGSVIIDLAAGYGGNCPLSVADQVVIHQGVKIVGWTNYPAMMPADASTFYANNCMALLDLIVQDQEGHKKIHIDLQDDLLKSAVVTLAGQVRWSLP